MLASHDVTAHLISDRTRFSGDRGARLDMVDDLCFLEGARRLELHPEA